MIKLESWTEDREIFKIKVVKMIFIKGNSTNKNVKIVLHQNNTNLVPIAHNLIVPIQLQEQYQQVFVVLNDMNNQLKRQA